MCKGESGGKENGEIDGKNSPFLCRNRYLSGFLTLAVMGDLVVNLIGFSVDRDRILA